MFEVKIDYSDFQRVAGNLSLVQGQIPYALSRSLNDANESAQTVLILNTWPRSVKVRNPSFLRAALRRKSSTKTDLTVEIFDTLNRGSLKMHAVGGTKTPRGAHLAIPNEAATPRGAGGVRKPDRPRALIARTPARSLRITPRAIFVGKSGRLQLRYTLRTTTPQPADVPFYEDYAIAIREGVRTNFPIWLRKALATARR
jgi:hypothetical protein